MHGKVDATPAAARNINAEFGEDFAEERTIATGSKGFDLEMKVSNMKTERFKKVLLFDNAAPHRAKVTTDKQGQLRYVHVPHPPYSPDIPPCDYHYFSSL
ncbi:unnamed protein product [Heligmosomoides polygyrus]|uniref:DDE_3 domain-containing protein n=1 Tax=Heligmosomoides polygyrus TaxID=6339 RepID=A0A183GG59_HELPZ|nr:unnamed protein product [Heligmosomoides polygyrus]